MWVQRQEASPVVARGAPDLAQGYLEKLAVRDGVRGQEVMDRDIGGQEGETVGQLEPPLVEATPGAYARAAQRRLVNQLQGQPGLNPLGGLASPAAEQVPGSQAEQLGGQEPEADRTVADLIGQELTNLPLDAAGIAREHGRARLGGPSGNRLGLAGTISIEFFFEDRLAR